MKTKKKLDIAIFFYPNKRIFLDTIYCYNQYRSLNIASKLSEIVDYLLQNYPGYTIRGIRDFKFIAKRNIISSIIKIILAIVLSLTPLEIIGV